MTRPRVSTGPSRLSSLGRRRRCPATPPSATVSFAETFGHVFANRLQILCTASDHPAAKDLKTADRAAKLTIQSVPLHRAVEVADHQLLRLRPYRTVTVRSLTVQGNLRLAGSFPRFAEVPGDTFPCCFGVIGDREVRPRAHDQLAGRAIVTHAVRLLVDRQSQPAIGQGNQVDAITVGFHTVNNSFAAGAAVHVRVGRIAGLYSPRVAGSIR